MKPRVIISVLLGVLLTITILGRVSSNSNINTNLYLPVVVNGENQTPPTRIELIEEALAAGKIDANTAAIYEVYTIIPNSPSQSQYVGSPDPQADIVAYRALWQVYGALSPVQKAAVDPYLRRLDEPSSA